MRSAYKSARLIVLGILLMVGAVLPSRMIGLTGANSIPARPRPPDATSPTNTRGDDSDRGTFAAQAPQMLPCAALSFSLPAPIYSAGSKPNGVATGDFNHDGKPDFAVASQASRDVTVYLGDGMGGFMLAGSFAALQGAFSVAVGDFNRDNNQDIVVANAFAAVNKISVLLGNGDGTFAAATNISAGSAPFQAVIGDFNGDGNPDIATANNTSANVSVLIGDGMGSFAAAVNFAVGTAPNGLAVGDFNNDRKLDIVTGSGDTNSISVLLGDGLGGFAVATSVDVGSHSAKFAVGDFNNDGKLDVTFSSFGTPGITVLLGNGAGGFAVSGSFPGTLSNGVAVGDLNGDGKLDIAVANSGTNDVTVRLGNGLGGFPTTLNFAVGDFPAWVALADFNGDGKLDMVSANAGTSNNASVLLNNCNIPPTINAIAVARVAGDPSATLAIANVHDDDSAPNALSVTVNNGTGATANGVTVSIITINPKGEVQAAVVAACGATSAAFTLKVTDGGGLTQMATLAVTVTPDITPPMITCPANIIKGADANLCSAVVTFNPAVTDNCPPCNAPQNKAGNGRSPSSQAVCAIVCTPASGTSFAKGTTTVRCTATDAAGNTASCSFTVTVFDTQPPSITCPQPVTRSTDANACTAVVPYAAPTVSENCSGVGLPACTPPSGSTFPKGVTDVTCSVSDASNHSSNCAFTVTVNDTQPPSFPNGCPHAISVIAALSCPPTTNRTVTYMPPAVTDNCPGVDIVCAPPSGSVFSVGTTTVACTATDASGNTAVCSFAVQVWTACLQDESNPGNVCLFNAQTGEYRFCCNGMVVATGTGVVTVRGCLVTIAHTKQQRRVSLRADLSVNRGTVTVIIADQTTCQITDQDMTNNGCLCPLSPSGSKP